MFDIAWGEFVVIGVVALIVIGPKELPAVLRAVGQWTTKIRRMAAEFQSQFQEALREAEMADLKKEVDNLNDVAKSVKSDFDALDYQRTVETAAYPTDASSAPTETPASPAVTADGYAPPPPDAFASPGETSTDSAPGSLTSPDQQHAPAETNVAEASPPATVPSVLEHAPASAVETAPTAGATAHDS